MSASVEPGDSIPSARATSHGIEESQVASDQSCIQAWTRVLGASEGTVAEDVWSAFDALGEGLRHEVVTSLRAEVMGLVRTSPPKALPPSECLLRAGLGLTDLSALINRTRAVALHANGRSEEAADFYQRALECYESQGEELEVARVRRSLVDVLQMAGRSESALEQAQLARPVLQRLNESRLLAQLECNVGNVYFRLDRYGSARPHYELAQSLFEQDGDDFGRAHALYNLGNIETNAHCFERARECFTTAKTVFQDVGHAVLSADCDYALAYLDIRRGRFADARRELLRARDGYGAEGKPSGQPLCDLDLCELYVRVDAHHDAVTFGRRAIERFDELGMQYESAKARMLVGMALAELRDEQEGAQQLRSAAQQFASIGNHTLGALATLHRVSFVKDAVGARAALPEVKVAATFLHESGDELLGQLAQLALADVLWRAGQVADARAALLEVAEEHESVDYDRLGLPNARIEALRSLASMEVESGSVVDAKKYLRTAVSWIDATLLHLTSGDARLSFFSRRQPAFAELASLLLEEGSAQSGEEAVALVERSRSRNMAQRLIDVHSSDEVRAAREQVDFLMRERWDAVLGEESGASGGARSATLLRDDSLLKAQEHLLELDRANRSRAGWDRVAPEDSASDSQAAWADNAPCLAGLAEGDRVLYYLTARDETYGVLLENRAGVPEVIQVEGLGRVEKQIRQQLSRARYYVEKRELGSRFSPRQAKAARTGLLSSLSEMGQMLLEPFVEAGQLESSPNGGLVVVPYGLLHAVPFSALMWKAAPLVCSQDVSVARSLEPLRGVKPHQLVNGGVLSCVGAAADLPAIETELARISEALGKQHRLLDAEHFLPALNQAFDEGLLHIPAHGSFEADHPLFAGLRLGDRMLAAFDVARLRLPPCLVVLSGCETGRQSIPHGEELYGTEQAFLTAGAAGVLGSLWPLSDEGCAELIPNFVQEIFSGANARQALSRVQRQAWRDDGALEDWASLTFAGDPYLRIPTEASGGHTPGRPS